MKRTIKALIKGEVKEVEFEVSITTHQNKHTARIKSRVSPFSGNTLQVPYIWKTIRALSEQTIETKVNAWLGKRQLEAASFEADNPPSEPNQISPNKAALLALENVLLHTAELYASEMKDAGHGSTNRIHSDSGITIEIIDKRSD